MFIYADITRDLRYALGYVRWYEEHAVPVILRLLPKRLPKNRRDLLVERMKKEKFHFSARIRKTHHVTIPADVLMMKLNGFLREQIDKELHRLDPKPVQLLLPFMYD